MKKKLKRSDIPRNPNKRPTKINCDRSLEKMREDNRLAILIAKGY